MSTERLLLFMLNYLGLNQFRDSARIEKEAAYDACPRTISIAGRLSETAPPSDQPSR